MDMDSPRDVPAPDVPDAPAGHRRRTANFWFHVTEGAMATFGGGLAGGSVFAVLVLTLGGTATTLGTIGSIASLSLLAPLLLAPRIEATRRKKRLVLWLGLGQRLPLLLTAGLLALLASRSPIACLYAIGVLGLARGVVDSLLVPPWQDLIAETIPIDRVGRLFGFRHLLANVLRLPSTLLCAGVIALFAFPLNFELVYLLSFAAMMVSWLLFSRVDEIPPSAAPAPRLRTVHYFRNLIAAVRDDRNYRRYLLYSAAARATAAAGMFLPLVAVQHYRMGEAEVVALAGVLTGIPMIAGSLLLPFVGERIGPKRMLALAVVVRAAGLAVAAVAPSGPVFVVAFFVLGLAGAATTVAGPPFMMRVFPRGKRIGYMALSGVVTAPIRIASPVVLGLAVTALGHSIVFGVAAVLVLTALPLLAGIALGPESQAAPQDKQTESEYTHAERRHDAPE